MRDSGVKRDSVITLLLVLLISCVIGRVTSVHTAEDKLAQVTAVVDDTDALKELEAYFLRSRTVCTLSPARIIFKILIISVYEILYDNQITPLL